jgi:hypothetical protein
MMGRCYEGRCDWWLAAGGSFPCPKTPHSAQAKVTERQHVIVVSQDQHLARERKSEAEVWLENEAGNQTWLFY